MKYAILGAGGMLGSGVVKVLNHRQIEYTTHKIVPGGKWLEELTVSDADVLINCAGALTQVHPTEQIYMNGHIPFMVRKVFKGRIVYVSTDCVFSGYRQDRWNLPTDIPDPTSTYGISKRMGELSADLVVRTSFIGLRHGLLRWAIDHDNETVEGWVGAKWNGSTARVVAESLVLLVDTYDFDKDLANGICHIASNQVVTKYDLLKMINEVFDLGLEIKPVYEPRINRALGASHINIAISLKNALYELYEEWIDERSVASEATR